MYDCAMMPSINDFGTTALFFIAFSFIYNFLNDISDSCTTVPCEPWYNLFNNGRRNEKACRRVEGELRG